MALIFIVAAAAGSFLAQFGRRGNGKLSPQLETTGNLAWLGFGIGSFLAGGWQAGLFALLAVLVGGFIGGLVTRARRSDPGSDG